MLDYDKLLQVAAQQGAWALAAVAIFIILIRYMAKREADDKGREEAFIEIVTNNTAAMSNNTANISALTIAISELRRDVTSLRELRERR